MWTALPTNDELTRSRTWLATMTAAGQSGGQRGQDGATTGFGRLLSSGHDELANEEFMVTGPACAEFRKARATDDGGDVKAEEVRSAACQIRLFGDQDGGSCVGAVEAVVN